MNTVWDAPGQAHAVRVLRDAAAHGQVGHAWAFVGPAQVGQQALARSVTAALNCTVAATGCGTCPSCERSLRGAHPAYWEFAPTGATHRVGEVRESWMRVASRTAERGAHKVLRIIDADRMNDAAANAFLKALEEPPERTLWVLELADPDELPDTILSRCRVLRMAPWDRATMRDAVVRHGATLDADGELAVRVATGAPGRLRTLLGPRGLQDVRSQREIPRQLRAEGPGFALVASRDLDDQMKAAIGAVRDEAAHEREQLAELYGDAPPRDVLRQIEQRATRREREVKTVVAQTALDDLAGWYRDVLLVRCGGDPGDAVHADDPDGLRADAQAMSQRVLLASLEAVFARREELEFNVQLGLLYEALLLELSTLALEG